MADITRRADAVWTGNLVEGNGEFSVGSGAIATQGVTWAARTEEPEGKTSPEELIAAAHASCYAMALSHTLTEAGHRAHAARGLGGGDVRAQARRRHDGGLERAHRARHG